MEAAGERARTDALAAAAPASDAGGPARASDPAEPELGPAAPPPAGATEPAPRAAPKRRGCAHCELGFVDPSQAATALRCCDCGEEVHLHCPSPGRCPVRAAAGVLEFPAQPPSRRAEVGTLLLLAPLLGGGFGVGIVFAELLSRALFVPSWIAYPMGLGGSAVPVVMGLALLFHRHLQHRSVHVDARGVALGVTPRWRGKRLRFADLRGFSETTHGVMLVVRAQPWTRWLGPLIRCDGLRRHELIERLEAEGVYRTE